MLASLPQFPRQSALSRLPRCTYGRSMITIHMKEINGTWFGLASAGEQIVATAVSSGREGVLRFLTRSIPSGVKHRIVAGESGFAAKTMVMLSRLDSGDEQDKEYSLSADYVAEPLARVLKAAAAIPIGYVTSYGNIAKTADTEAKAVGRVMASNPLYPIVPCHRVVGADFSLVGYGGKRNLPALQAKLARLSREVRGFAKAKEITVNGRKLEVYPAEWVTRKAERVLLKPSRQRSLFEQARTP